MITSIIKDLFGTSAKSFPKSYMDFGKGDKLILDIEMFIKMYKADKESVKGAKFVLPHLGEEDFGKFVVDANPIHKEHFELIDE